jgi:hypothetical protein
MPCQEALTVTGCQRQLASDCSADGKVGCPGFETLVTHVENCWRLLQIVQCTFQKGPEYKESASVRT